VSVLHCLRSSNRQSGERRPEQHKIIRCVFLEKIKGRSKTAKAGGPAGGSLQSLSGKCEVLGIASEELGARVP